MTGRLRAAALRCSPGPAGAEGRVRIALVSEVFPPAVDGVVTRLRRTLEELPRCGDDVLMIAPAGGPESYAGVPVLGVRGLRVPLYPDGDGYPPKRVALPGPALSRALRAYRPDVVHAIQPVLLGVGAVAFARRNRVPLVASYHAHLPSYAKLYRLRWLGAARRALLPRPPHPGPGKPPPSP